ncbi:hypothetical protein GCM10010191_52020 [Actinomadura vinacea]|uniref:Transposase n=1 Tax=Actinomadura vinacea TaxID=115336 RepID=A0ABP5WP99_9ACTN
MPRYRLDPTPEQEQALLSHCAHARYVWNLAVEQHGFWSRRLRGRAPGYPPPVPGPGDGTVVGVDRGVAVSAALSTGDLLKVPGLTPGEARRLELLARKLGRARRGSGRRARLKAALARLKARERDRRKNWVEQTSTRLAREFDVIGVEDLNTRGMTRSAKGTLQQPGRNVAAKAGLNRGILASGWGLLVERLEHKAPGRVHRIDPAYTSQRCSACGTTDREARESQARFRCRSCGHAGNADVNAARNIAHEARLVGTAAGPAVPARGRSGLPGRTNREPQPVPLS